MEEKDVLRLAFEAWKSQVDTFWIRSSYFVVFELAIAAGLWKVFDGRHFFTSIALATGAVLLTCLWVLNNARLGEYINFYWYRLVDIDSLVQPDRWLRIFSLLEDKRKPKRFPGNYRHYIEAIPFIFLGGWLWMLVWSSFEVFCQCLRR